MKKLSSSRRHSPNPHTRAGVIDTYNDFEGLLSQHSVIEDYDMETDMQLHQEVRGELIF